MSLSARQRILKLRETEFRLQKLQNDLLNGEDTSTSSTRDFLAHHKELMSMPGTSRNSIPFRFDFQAQKRYTDVRKSQTLTLPPKVSQKSVTSIIKPYKDMPDKQDRSPERIGEGLAQYPSLALQTLYNQLDEQTSKMAIAFPKFDKFLGSPTFRSKQILNSDRYVRLQPSQKGISSVASKSSNKGSGASLRYTRTKLHDGQQKNVKSKTSTSFKSSKTWKPSRGGILKTDSGTIAPPLLTKDDRGAVTFASSSQVSLAPESDNESEIISRDEVEVLRNSVAIALASSNLAGVFLSSQNKPYNSSKRGPSSWSDRASQNSSTVDCNDAKEDAPFTTKDALHLLKRKIPERSIIVRERHLPPHRRGLIGVEISSFEPECSFFYRDRSGNYNPHLHHSAAVTGSMKKGSAVKLLKDSAGQ